VLSSASFDPPVCPSVHCLWGGTVLQKIGKMSESVPHWCATVLPTFSQVLRVTWAQAVCLSTSRQRPLAHLVVLFLGAQKFDVTTLLETF